MVVIINGEVVPDNDPRARAYQTRRAAPSRASSAQPQQPAHGARNQRGPPNPRPATQHQSEGGVLHSIATTLGIQGRSITVPEVLGIPSSQVQYIHLLLTALLTFFFGWRVLIVAAGIYWYQNRDAQPAQSGSAGAQPRGNRLGAQPTSPS